jgi:thymidylate synthase (FAD)
MDNHAQIEIRKYANTIFDITEKVAPISCEAFEDYRLDSVRFSKQEICVIKEHLSEINLEGNSILSSGEKGEFEEKLKKVSK